MSFRVKFILFVVLVLIFPALLLIETFTIKVALTALLVLLTCYLGLIASREQTERARISGILTDVEQAYDDLDEQAKLILKTDLKLNKAQEELDKRIDGLYTLHELGKSINKTFKLNDLLALVTSPLIFKLGFDKAFLALYDLDKKTIVATSAAGYKQAEIDAIKKVITSEDFFTQSLSEAGLKKLACTPEQLKTLFAANSAIITPLLIEEKISGFIVIGNESAISQVTEMDEELVAILANQIGIAIENVQLYEELWNSQRELALKVKDRTKELEKANEELKKLDARKKEFVSAVSHELRTPLTSIKGYASILTAGKLGTLSPEQRERLEKINKHSNNLVDLVNNLLDISRIESGRVEMNLQSLSLRELIDNCVDIITPQLKDSAIELETIINSPDLTITGDKTQIERVFINLLSNAIKFTPEKGTITITATTQESMAHIEVRDTGSGIEAKDLSKIFDEFYRVDNATNQNVKGTGLGLPLVKHIIEAHGGSIGVSSIVGAGTTFTFTLPLA